MSVDKTHANDGYESDKVAKCINWVHYFLVETSINSCTLCDGYKLVSEIWSN